MRGAEDVVLSQLLSGRFLLERFTPDLSDEEYFVPPLTGGNHTAWNLGHIAFSEGSICADLAGTDELVPEATRALFRAGSERVPDTARYPSRREIDEMYHDVRAQVAAALKTFDERRWNDRVPEGYPKDVFPTVGPLWGQHGTHQFWHIGEIAVCRKVLGKGVVLTQLHWEHLVG